MNPSNLHEAWRMDWSGIERFVLLWRIQLRGIVQRILSWGQYYAEIIRAGKLEAHPFFFLNF
jgi:hypothetical protein